MWVHMVPSRSKGLRVLEVLGFVLSIFLWGQTTGILFFFFPLPKAVYFCAKPCFSFVQRAPHRYLSLSAHVSALGLRGIPPGGGGWSKAPPISPYFSLLPLRRQADSRWKRKKPWEKDFESSRCGTVGKDHSRGVGHSCDWNSVPGQVTSICCRCSH